MENNVAIKAKLGNIKKIDGADKIVSADIILASVPISTVVVGVDSVEGQDIIYFDSNLCLSDIFITRRPELKTYLAKGNRVRCIKLKGVISNGLCVPIEAFLEFTKDDIPDSFTHLNGVEICKKWLPPQQESGSHASKMGRAKNAKKENIVIKELFNFHIDTQQLIRNLHKINPTDVISISRKVHGCFSMDTLISLVDGTKKPIKDICIGDVLLGYNHSTNKIIPSKVINTFINGETDSWCKVKFRGRKVVYTTHNHEFLTDRGYVHAKDLETTDRVFFPVNAPVINDMVFDVLLGKSLGDGSLQSNSKSLMIQLSHKCEHESYLDYCISMLGNLNNGVKKTYYMSGYGTQMVRWHSLETYAINNTLKNYLTGHKFGITENLVSDLTPRSLAIWYMDDGSLMHSDVQEDRAGIAICSFDESTFSYIRSALAKFNITDITFYSSSNKGNSKHHNRIRINKDSADTLFNLIKEYVPPCMQYKLPEKYRGYFVEPCTTYNNYGNEFVCIPYEVNDVTTVKAGGKQGYVKYDLETETHNYVANGIIVHNCSAIVSHGKIKNKQSLIDRILHRNETSWGYLFASRTVVKNADGKFHDDLWSNVGQQFVGKLHKGETVYYEIIGYFPGTSTYIQKGYDYGCAVGEYKIAVYRITMTNDDGVVTEYSWAAMRERCKELNTTPVTEFYFGRACDLVPLTDTWHIDFAAFLKKEYLEKTAWDNISKKVPDEGVVIRVEAKDITVFKYKSEAFFLQESQAADAGEVDTEAGA